MGKTTLYHPVSLHVIRGSLEACGFKVSRIKQLGSNKETRWAKYTCNLVTVTRNFSKLSPYDIVKTLDSCFSKDITLTSYSEYRENKKYIIRAKIVRTIVIETDLSIDSNEKESLTAAPDALGQTEANDLSWLVDPDEQAGLDGSLFPALTHDYEPADIPF